jgi:RNA polymerase sigma-70 factor (ECF subfamily)
MSQTPVSLLEKLQTSGNQAAWERFVQLYTPLMHHWARRLGLADADAADLVQDVFTILVEKLPEFRYDPQRRFRAWLWTILVNKSRNRRCTVPTAALHSDEQVVSAEPDPADELAEREYRGYLIRRALDLIRSEFQASTWEAFWECTTTDASAADVAAKLGLSVGGLPDCDDNDERQRRQGNARVQQPPALCPRCHEGDRGDDHRNDQRRRGSPNRFRAPQHRRRPAHAGHNQGQWNVHGQPAHDEPVGRRRLPGPAELRGQC